MYYAWENEHGRISPDSFGGRGRNGYEYLAFDTKKERDEYVDENRFDFVGNTVCGAITRKQLEEELGKFVVCGGSVYSKSDFDEIYFNRFHRAW